MMDYMTGGGMMWGMGSFGLLVIVACGSGKIPVLQQKPLTLEINAGGLLESAEPFGRLRIHLATRGVEDDPNDTP